MYFKRTETHMGYSKSEAHGFEGPIHAVTVKDSHPDRKYPLREMFKSAWERLGVKAIEDGHCSAWVRPSIVGTVTNPKTINWHGTAIKYLTGRISAGFRTGLSPKINPRSPFFTYRCPFHSQNE